MVANNQIQTAAKQANANKISPAIKFPFSILFLVC